MKLPVTLDLETDAIFSRPAYPPRPVGLAVKFPGKASYYLGWGHPDSTTPENFGKAKELLAQLYAGDDQLCFWNGKFDLEVIEKFFDLPVPHWKRVEDGLYLSYLQDPHAPSLALKPTAERLLHEVPSEQDAVRDWLISQKIVRANQKDWGAHISKAPEKLVATYARADVEKTAALFKLLYPQIRASKMLEAYNRERELQPILLRNEQQGIRCDVVRLGQDIDRYQGALAKVERWIRKTLKAPSLNLNADREVAEALEGHVTEWVLTPTGQRSVSKPNLKIDDPKLAAAHAYMVKAKTCLGTFMCPWGDLAKKNGGRLCTSWNQTRGDRGGTRTGRLSSSTPLNLQNIPKSFTDKGDGYTHPTFLKVPPLPSPRQYILPDEGHVILHRDYNQQEVRILAHFEDGKLAQAYNANVNLDFHEFTRLEIERVAGVRITRRAAKTLNLGLNYAMGIQKLADALGIDVDTAQSVKAAHRAALPGIAELDNNLKRMGRRGEPIRTWGGRLYLPEPPSNGRTYEFRLLNILCQGSAADVTKQALINYERSKEHGTLSSVIHDEINLSVAPEHVHTEMRILREAMESVPMDVAMLTDGKVSASSWAELEKYDEYQN